jgi:NAD(P)-dependent dehydrogenase (short-subunit alcohol dehydrogenase family)
MDPGDHAAVVTGGASGLGEETAIRLARAGVKVAVFDLNREAARKAASTIGGIGIECDVSDPDSTTTAFKQARESMDPPALLLIAQASAQQSASWVATDRCRSMIFSE